MKWEYWMELFLYTHCSARCLRNSTINAYREDLTKFRSFVRFRLNDKGPDEIVARDVLEYIEYRRKKLDNGTSALNRIVTVLKCFYRAMVAMNHLDPDDNPMKCFPRMKKAAKKLPVFLDKEEIKKMLNVHKMDTIIGVRDKAIVILLYGTGIRASECSSVKEQDVDLRNMTIKVVGKGGGERTVPLNEKVAEALQMYRNARGIVKMGAPFFKSRNGGGMSRNAIYERVRTAARKAKVKKVVSPHRLRHTFATHLLREGVNLVTLRDLLGHKMLTSTQVYLHTTAEDLRRAAAMHPVESLIEEVGDLLPDVKLPFQWPKGTKMVNAG